MFHYKEKSLTINKFEFTLYYRDKVLSVAEVLDLWANSFEFRSFYTRILEETPFTGFFWENCCFDIENLNVAYAFVIIGDNRLRRVIGDENTFPSVANTRALNVCFQLQDCSIVSPTALLDAPAYCHLASFIRNAPIRQIDHFWSLLGKVVKDELGAKRRVWLRTYGLDFNWVNVKIETSSVAVQHTGYQVGGCSS